MTENTQLRHCAFTWNNYQEDSWQEAIQSAYKTLEMNYLIYGYEIAPKTGTPHLQGYMQFSKRKYFSSIKKALPKIHITVCNGSSQDNIEYCKKSDAFVEMGAIRSVARGRAKQERDWNILVDKAVHNRLDEIKSENPREYIVYYRTWKSIAIDHIEAKAHPRCCFWVFGDPGVGKSRAIHALFPNAYWKNGNKWWDGYQGEPEVVLDDLDNAKLYSHLKRWADRYKVIGEVKGASVNLTYKTFVVTSNYDPVDLGNLDAQVDRTSSLAVARRFVILKAIRWSHPDQDLVVRRTYPDKDPGEFEQPEVLLRSVVENVVGWDFDSQTCEKDDEEILRELEF